jgi:hypothetical protein
MTAPTPIMIPRAVSTERSLFRRKARSATLNVGAILILLVEMLKGPLFESEQLHPSVAKPDQS